MAVAPLGDEFQVNTFSTGDQQTAGNQSVAMDAAGNFVVVWQSQGQDGDGWGVYGQRFNIDGQKLGEEFLVNETIVGDQTSPAVAMNASGQFVVAWNSTQPQTAGVYVQRFSAAGDRLDGEQRILDSGTPSADIDADGNYVVQSARAADVTLQIFAASGLPSSSVFSGLEPGRAIDPNTVTTRMNGDGSVAILYYLSEFIPTPPRGETVYYALTRKVSLAGTPLGAPTTLFQSSFSSAPLAATNSHGDTVTVWPGHGLVTSLGARISVAPYQDLAVDDRAESIGVWASSGVQFQTVDRFGAITSEGSASTGASLQPSVAVSGEVAIVVWTRETSRDIVARRYSAGPTPDPTPPVVARVEGIREDGVLVDSSLELVISEALSTAGGATGDSSVTNLANWRLLRDGAEAAGDLQSVHYEFVPSLGQHRVTVTLAAQLPSGNYELRMRGTVRDLAGNQLAGDGQAAGTDFLASFIRPAKTLIAGMSVGANAVTAIGATLGLTVWSTGGSLWGQVFSPEFATAVGSPVNLTMTSDVPQQVLALEEGRFFVTWGSATHTRGRLVDGVGAVPLGDEVILASRPVAVAATPGGVLAGWIMGDQVHLLWIHRDGGTDSLLIAAPPGASRVLSVAGGSDGRVALAVATPDGARLQLLNASGVPLGGWSPLASAGVLQFGMQGELAVTYGEYRDGFDSGGIVSCTTGFLYHGWVLSLSLFDPLGNPLAVTEVAEQAYSESFSGCTGPSGHVWFPRFANPLTEIDDRGHVRLVWQETTPAGEWILKQRTFDETGAAVTAAGTIPSPRHTEFAEYAVRRGEMFLVWREGSRLYTNLVAAPTLRVYGVSGLDASALSPTSAIEVAFSQSPVTGTPPVEPGDVQNPSNWAIARDGNEVPGIVESIAWEEDPAVGRHRGRLKLRYPLPNGQYELVCRDSILDLGGLPLDGDGDGAPGGDFRRSFRISLPQIPNSPELLVNSTTTGDQQLASVSRRAVGRDSAGNFVVAWAAQQPQSDGWDVYARRFDPAGTPQGDEFRVNASTVGNQFSGQRGHGPRG